MKNIKLFVYGLLHGYHNDMCVQYNAWIEDASLAGNHKEVKYCCACYDKHLAKSNKYYSKMMEIRDQKKGA
jgi:hypothetical protein